MKPEIRHFLVAVALPGLLALAPGQARAGTICVQNADPRSMFFAAENKAGARATAELAQGASLCLSDAGGGGTVSVFVDQDAVEGCSRLVAAGQSEVLLAFSEFDRCRWASNDG